MKKVSALILALTMCTAMLTACGGGNSTTTSSTGSAAPAPTTSAATSEAGADEGYKLVKEGTLTMATNAQFPPMNTMTARTSLVLMLTSPRPLLTRWGWS